jgi:hypothetical protein
MELALYYAVCFIIGLTISRTFRDSFENPWVSLAVSLVFVTVIILWINVTIMAPYLS